MSDYRIWECIVCGWVYDESKGWPDDGIEPGTKWEDVPEDWLCPDCGVGKEDFEMIEVGTAAESNEVSKPAEAPAVAVDAQEKPYQVWECLVCGWMYDEAKGWPDDGIAPGTRWDDVPEDWLCPDCGVGKEDFEMVAVSRSEAPPAAAPAAAPSASGVDHSKPPVVIVGTGLAGYNLARELRKLDTSTPLVLVTNDDGRFYSKPLISTGYHKGKTADELATASAEDMAGQLNAEIRIFTKVESADTGKQSITVRDEYGTSTIDYGKLVLATGARCIEAPLEGDGLDRVYSINDLLDYTRFRTAMVNRKKVLVIGAGLIGSEYTNDLIQCGYDLDIVDPLDSVLGTLLPKTASDSVKNALAAKGARFHFGTVVKRVDRNGTGVRATLGNGEVIEADIVLSAIGVRPNLELAESMGLACNRGIVTDRTLKTSVDNVYALGDCAEVDGHVLFYIAPLMECARKLASTLAGTVQDAYYGTMPVTVKTTLFPVVVSPPPREAKGAWHIEVDQPSGVRALFRNDDKQLLGFALTGDCISTKDALNDELQPIMAKD